METNLYGYSFRDPVNFYDLNGETSYPIVGVGLLISIGILYDAYKDILKSDLDQINERAAEDARSPLNPRTCPIPNKRPSNDFREQPNRRDPTDIFRPPLTS